MSHTQNRRSFVSSLASLAGLAALEGNASAAQAPARGNAPAGQWDLTWFDGFKGAHKQMYDYGTFDITDDTRPLRFVKNYLDTYRDVFGQQGADINTAVGISRSCFPINVSDAVWQKYKIGERWKITDAATKQPAVRNIFLTDGDLSVKAMQARGTAFWQCNVALGAITQQFAQATGMPAAEVRADLVAGLNPGVHLVPAHVMALGIAQEHGFTYMKT
jgi:intracellular sulfur oxidation DsrE/DsrF family protein